MDFWDRRGVLVSRMTNDVEALDDLVTDSVVTLFQASLTLIGTLVAVSLAARAPGYGFPGAVVDGNDLLAVHAVTQQAVERARAGHGPTLIESMTYRMGPHNTADDPTRYITEAELAPWRELDPIIRVQRYLAGRGRWSESDEAAATAELAQQVEDALTRARAYPAPHAGQIFDHVYANPPQRLLRQRVELLGDR